MFLLRKLRMESIDLTKTYTYGMSKYLVNEKKWLNATIQ